MRQNQIDRIRIEKEVAEYLKKGGKVKELPPFEHDKNVRKVHADDGLRSTGQPS